MKRFFLRKTSNVSFAKNSDSTKDGVKKQKTFVLNCPHCQFTQEVLFKGISTFCKSCQQVINLEKVFYPPNLPVTNRPVLKKVVCFHCKNDQSIPSKALSSFCKKCGKRINLQNYKISGKFNGSLETQGTIHVTRTGELRSNIVCHSAIIEGKINGTIRALEKVELRQTANLRGSIQAKNLVVKEGASFRGASRISPSQGLQPAG